MGRKGEQTKEKIIQSALFCLGHYGDRQTTFQKIADHCGVSQPLVVKYFKSRDEIFPSVLNYLLNQARELTEKALLADGTPEEKLKNYFRVSLQIFRQSETVSKIYLTLYYLAGIEDRYRKLNSTIKEVAVDRIEAILKEGIKKKRFVVSDVRLTAKTIHNSLTGLLLNMITEDPLTTEERYVKTLEDLCLRSIQAKS